MGVLLIVFGLMLLVWGYEIYSSPDPEASTTIPPFQAWVGMIVGTVNIFVGIIKLKSK